MIYGTIPNVGSFPATVSVHLVKGDDWLRQVTFKDDSTNGAPVNLTGSTFDVVIVRPESSDVLARPAVSVVNATQGVISISIDATTTENLKAGLYVADPDGLYFVVLRITDSQGNVFTVLRIKLQLTI